MVGAVSTELRALHAQGRNTWPQIDVDLAAFSQSVEGRLAPDEVAKLHAGEPPKEIEGAKPIELVRLYVSQEWLGRGAGEALMRACVDETRNTGHETLWLGVWERNARAQAFYRKWDFRAVGEHMFQLGSDMQRDILMERTL